MDEISVFRRFFVATAMIRELLSSGGGMGGGAEPQSSETPPHLGGGTRSPILDDHLLHLNLILIVILFLHKPEKLYYI